MVPAKPVIVSLFAAAALAASAAPGLAQPPAAAAAAPSADHRDAWRQYRQQRFEMGARRLHDILNLRPDQDPALNALVAALAPAPRATRGGEAGWAALTTPERLDRISARADQWRAAVQRKSDAVKAFYAALSPAQKRALDALWPDRSGRRQAMWIGAVLGFAAGHADRAQ